MRKLKDQKPYDWATALFAVASTNSEDLGVLSAAAELDPKGGDLSDIDLSNLDLSGQDLSGWDLRSAKFEKTKLAATELRNAIVDPYELIQAEDWEKAKLDENLKSAAARSYALTRLVDDLNLSTRSKMCCLNDNIFYVGDLVQRTEAEMLRVPNFGRKSLNEVKEILAEMGMHLGMEIPGWPPERIRDRRS